MTLFFHRPDALVTASMRRFPRLLVVGLSLFSLSSASGCQGGQPEPLPPAYTPTASIKDLMDSMVDPSADDVWDAVTTEISASGTVEKVPRTDEEWTKARHGALRLVEASNLLMMPGRHVAQPGQKSEFPGIELEPDQMEALINKDRDAWIRRAKGLHDAVIPVLQAIDGKDPQKLFELGAGIETACENCHMQYWYPNEKTLSIPSDRQSNAP
jgi:hypothetical protein